MAWYWIVLTVLGYLVVGIAIAVFFEKIKAINEFLGLEKDPVALSGVAVFWPICIVFFAIYIIFGGGGLFIQWLSKKL